MSPVKVFISWSGERSKKAAQALGRALDEVHEDIHVWTSDKDIPQGSIWPKEVMDNLYDSDIGVICLTEENMLSPWINFEAGVLYRGSKSKKIHPVFVDPRLPNIMPPLGLFQCTVLNVTSFIKILEDCRYVMGDGCNYEEKQRIDQEVIENTDKCWNAISGEIEAIKNTAAPPRISVSVPVKSVIIGSSMSRKIEQVIRNMENGRFSFERGVDVIRKGSIGTPEEKEAAVEILRKRTGN